MPMPEDLPGSGDLRSSFRWNDTVCIDQSNLAESAQQVGFMAKIYATAHSDLLWLGEDAENRSEAAFSLVRRIVQLCDVHRDPNNHGNYDLEALQKATQSLVELEGLTLLDAVFALPLVWKRVWVVQEVAMARQVYICSGAHVLEWEAMRLFLMGPILSLVPDERWLICMKSKWYLAHGTFAIPIAMSALRTRLRETAESLPCISL
jgi:hypothetical protein